MGADDPNCLLHECDPSHSEIPSSRDPSLDLEPGGTHLHGVLLEGTQREVPCAGAQERKLTRASCRYAAVCTPLAIPLLHARILQ